MTIRLTGSTSGYTEIDAPAVAGSNTLVLPTGNGTADQALVTNGSGALSFADRGRMVLETAKAYNWNGLTTNTSIDFTGIPSWVKRVTVMFSGVSTNGTSPYLIQIGDSGGIEITDYTSGSAASTSDSTSDEGFVLRVVAANDTAHGTVTVANFDANTWVSSHALFRTNTNVSIAGGGSKTLSSTLDRIRITTVNGTDTFDAGTINILMEG
jgi:hypothetical protein